jgi:hypothetical protein
MSCVASWHVSQRGAPSWRALLLLVALALSPAAGGDAAAAPRWNSTLDGDQKVNWQLAYKTTSAVDEDTLQGWDAATIQAVRAAAAFLPAAAAACCGCLETERVHSANPPQRAQTG